MAIGQEFNVDHTRSLFGKRLGEIIEGVIGDARVRELFDAAGKHPNEYEGKPTGLIALDLGVITPDTKTALLLAQAAERTLQLVEATEAFGVRNPTNKDELVNAKKLLVEIDDPVFKFVGSPRDPQIIQQAQATWKLAQINYNHQIVRFEDANISSHNTYNIVPSQNDIDALKKAAAGFFATASTMLEAEGHDAAAEKLNAVSTSVRYGSTTTTLSILAKDILTYEECAVDSRNMWLHSDDIVYVDGSFISVDRPVWSVPQKFSDEMTRLSNLVEPDAQDKALVPQGPNHNKM